MLSEGRSQREIAEHLGLRDKNVVKELLKRERRKERKIKAGLKLRPKGRPRKRAEAVDIVAEQAYEIKRLKMENELLRDFCSSQKGSEGKGKVHGNIPAQGAVSHIGRVSILWSIQERILRFLQANWRSGTGCRAGRASSVTAREMQADLWLPKDVAVVREAREPSIRYPEGCPPADPGPTFAARQK